jgi:hypothetical protein
MPIAATRGYSTFSAKLDVLLSIVINPNPSVMTAQAKNKTGRYVPTRVMIIPEIAEVAAAPSEYGSILTPAPVAEEPSAWKYKGR